MKQHAFIFQVHKQPELLLRILQVLEKDNHHFFINVDKKVKNKEPFYNAAKTISNVHFLTPEMCVYHGGVSQIDCTLKLIEMVKFSGIDYDYIHSLSGQDYPLRSNEQFDEFFEHTDESFFAIEDDDYNLKCMTDGQYYYRVNKWHLNNNYSVIAKVYRHSGIQTTISKTFKRPIISGLRGGVELVLLVQDCRNICA